MIPEEVKYIDKIRCYKDATLQMSWYFIKNKEKREDIKIVMKERCLLK